MIFAFITSFLVAGICLSDGDFFMAFIFIVIGSICAAKAIAEK